jgi:hypothetical protein
LAEGDNARECPPLPQAQLMLNEQKMNINKNNKGFEMGRGSKATP